LQKFYFIIVIFLLFQFEVKAQQYNKYVHYTTENGLPANNLYNGFQSKDGFIYLNSTTGLIQYDGYDFKNFDVSDGLLDTDLLYSYEDNLGRIWMVPFSENLFFLQHGKIHNKLNDPLVKKICDAFHDNVFFQFKVSDNDVICLYKLNSSKILLLHDTSMQLIQLPKNEKVKFAYQYEGTLLIQGVENYTYKKFKLEKVTTSFNEIRGNQIVKVGAFLHSFSDGHNRKYFRLNKFCISANDSLKHVASKQIPVVNSQRGITYFNQKFYFASQNKIYTCDANFEQLTLYKTLPVNAVITCIFFDKKSNMWAVSANDGVFLFLNNEVKLIAYPSQLDEKFFYKIHVDDRKNIYTATSNYIYKLTEKIDGFKKEILVKLPIADRGLKKIVVDKDDLYFAYKPNEVYCFNKKVHTIKHIIFPESILGFSLKDIDVMNKDSLLVASGNKAFLIEHGHPNVLYNARSTAIAYSRQAHECYIGTLNSLIKYDFVTKKTFDLSTTNKILQSRILNIMIDANQVVWVSTSGNGLVGLYGDKVLYQLTTKNGLINDNINGISLNKQNEIMVSTNNGITVLNYNFLNRKIKQISTRNYNIEDGLIDNFVNDTKMLGNDLYIASNNGLSLLNTTKCLSDTINSVFISQVKINNQLVTDEKLKALSHTENFIRFCYSSMNFKHRNSFYRYRLLPIQKNWVLTNEHVKEFGPLSPDEYSFEIMPCNKDGKSIGKPSIVSFVIRKAFWQTIWFKLLILLTLTTILYFTFKSYFTNKQNEINHQHELADLKIKALRAQMNPHFIFNCLNTIQGFMNEGNNLESNRFITKFSHLIRQTLNFSSETFVSIDKEVDYIKTYIMLERMRFNESFDFKIDVDDEIETSKVFIPSMLVQPLVENAIRHGLRNNAVKGNLYIKFYLQGNSIKIIVEDDGKGFDAKNDNGMAHDSKGLSLIYERIKTYSILLNTEIKLDVIDRKNNEKLLTGTQATLSIPL
jgi:ligand-binding sensor domain-containing protein